MNGVVFGTAIVASLALTTFAAAMLYLTFSSRTTGRSDTGTARTQPAD